MLVQQQKSKKMCLRHRVRDVLESSQLPLAGQWEGAAAVFRSPVGPTLVCVTDPPSSLKIKLFFFESLIVNVLNYLPHRYLRETHLQAEGWIHRLIRVWGTFLQRYDAFSLLFSVVDLPAYSWASEDSQGCTAHDCLYFQLQIWPK